MKRPLTLAYSPCPNDTFIFAAWTQGLLTGAPPVEVVLEDVEALNQAALQGRYCLTKVSYGAIPALLPNYRILRAGGALGHGCGPLVVTRPGTVASLADLGEGTRIAIPGRMTTAFLLLQLACERPLDVTVMRFDEIMPAVAAGTVDAGLIIHESRFTYQNLGLTAVADLGAWWEETTGNPIPLGAILVRRDIPRQTALEVDHLIQASLRYAYAHPNRVAPYVREHAFEMDERVMQAHIELYVNAYSEALGERGEAAVSELFRRGTQARIFGQAVEAEFV